MELERESAAECGEEHDHKIGCRAWPGARRIAAADVSDSFGSASALRGVDAALPAGPPSRSAAAGGGAERAAPRRAAASGEVGSVPVVDARAAATLAAAAAAAPEQSAAAASRFRIPWALGGRLA